MKVKYTRVRGKEKLVGERRITYVKGLRQHIGEENFALLVVTGKVTFEKKTGDPELDAVITYEIIKEAK